MELEAAPAVVPQAPVKEVEVAVVREAEVSEEEVQETASPAPDDDTTSRDSDESGQVIEEDLPDQVESIVDLSDRVDFIVDQGGDSPSTDSEKSGWTIEEDEFDQLEETRDEE